MNSVRPEVRLLECTENVEVGVLFECRILLIIVAKCLLHTASLYHYLSSLLEYKTPVTGNKKGDKER